jgi:hypothetical protein
MNTEFVPYKQALALKELGFDEPCFGYYLEDGTWTPASYSKKGTVYPSNTDLLPDWSAAPLYSQAFRWFREKYGLCSWIERMYTADSICYYRYTCEYKKDPLSKTHEVILSLKEYDNYEEAESACLVALIKIVKKQNSE